MSQACTPMGDEVSYGTGNNWIGYVYDNSNLTNYKGYVNEGTTTSPDFYQAFGGYVVSYITNGCPVQTESFSVRYKLKKAFIKGTYQFTVAADDGYRLSLDGGATWVINKWGYGAPQTTTYTIALDGTYDMVLDYFEGGGGNYVSFKVTPICGSTGDPAEYGTNNKWIGYVYDSTNLAVYKGFVIEGTDASPNFDQSFGGTWVNYKTSDCSVLTETFSVRYRLKKTFTPGSYEFLVGGDNGYRLSLDGGATWVINKWIDQSYNITSYTATLDGTYDMVLEYYEGTGSNRISFALQSGCGTTGDPSVYGTGNKWIGYVYDSMDLTGYKGYITEGSDTSADFDQSFGGAVASYSTSDCFVQTETFSVRYKLRKTFTPGNYEFILGGDNGYRLSLDGGASWVINKWTDQSYALSYYTVTLNGTYDMVLEYYENTGSNRISFKMLTGCGTTGNPSVYGTDNKWIGYVYDGMAMNAYKGFVTEGTDTNPNFDQSFGGSFVNYSTSDCFVQTETFSVRYRLRKTFAPGNYEFIVGADDGYRLSLDGGATWVINRWAGQAYNTAYYSANLNGTYDMVLEYFESTGPNRVSFAVQASLCGTTGDTTVYGTNNKWIGYVYDGMNMNSYRGYVTEGSDSSANFDQNFGGSYANYATSDCFVNTETFSVRYRLKKTFTIGNYEFIAGGDGGYRLSLDGGTTWVINRWTDQSYNTAYYSAILNGTYDMVLEYYENAGANRVSFKVQSSICGTTGDTTAYGTNNKWIGYVYDGMNMNSYRGFVTEGSDSSANFDQSFGGPFANYATSDCFVNTETFSARYRLTKTFTNGNYEFIVGGEGGYRLSLDGGATWIISRWADQAYAVTYYTAALNGTYNMVLEYFENTGSNRVTFAIQSTCGTTGETTVYGTGNKWIGYVYDGMNMNSYKGFVTEGTDTNPNFDQSFGGNNVAYATSDCFVQTETFSVRYRLRKTFTSGNYEFIVTGDNGFRLSLDGGATWVINSFVDLAPRTLYYSAALDGTYDMVLEFFESSGGNRIAFTVQTGCGTTGDPAVYGTNNKWIGYVYDGTDMNVYKGFVTEGITTNPNFDQSFGGNASNYTTSDCFVQTESFSMRYKLRKNFSPGTYIISVGGDERYRLSLDGGATWAIDYTGGSTYFVSTISKVLNGDYDMVIEYAETTGSNRISFTLSNILLSSKFGTVQLSLEGDKPRIEWITLQESASAGFSIERSENGSYFHEIGFQATKAIGGESSQPLKYQYTDNSYVNASCYYRVVMIDQKGAKTYSKVLFYDPKQKTSITLFPTIINNNRFKLKTNLPSEKLNLQVIDFSGRKYYEANFTSVGNNQAQDIIIPGIKLKPGMYKVVIRKGNVVLLQQTVMAE